MIVLIACFGYYHCTGRGDVNKSDGDIIGKWHLVSMSINGSFEPVDSADFLEVNADGTFLEYSNGDYGAGTWHQADGKLDLNYDCKKTVELYSNRWWIFFLPVSYTITTLDSEDLTLKSFVLIFEIVTDYTKE
jgi:hypothetical protein